MISRRRRQAPEPLSQCENRPKEPRSQLTTEEQRQAVCRVGATAAHPPTTDATPNGIRMGDELRRAGSPIPSTDCHHTGRIILPGAGLVYARRQLFRGRTGIGMITTVIFDLDDTLYDEVDFCRSGFQAAARHIATLSDKWSACDIFETIWKCFTTGDRGSTFNAALAELGIPCDAGVIARLVEVYRTHMPDLVLPPESRNALDELRGKYTLGLLTDGFLPTQKLKVQALGIEHYFKAIVYTEELGREHWKPSPRGFEKALEMLDARPKHTVYVADNETKDFIAPNRLGLLTIQVLRASGLYRQPSPLAEAAPKRRIDRIDELSGLLADC